MLKFYRMKILLFQDAEGWVAQCLNYDIAAFGKTIPEAQRAFANLFLAEVIYLDKTGKTLKDLPEAPEWYWDKYEEAYSVSKGKSAIRRAWEALFPRPWSIRPQQKDMSLKLTPELRLSIC